MAHSSSRCLSPRGVYAPQREVPANRRSPLGSAHSHWRVPWQPMFHLKRRSASTSHPMPIPDEGLSTRARWLNNLDRASTSPSTPTLEDAGSSTPTFSPNPFAVDMLTKNFRGKQEHAQSAAEGPMVSSKPASAPPPSSLFSSSSSSFTSYSSSCCYLFLCFSSSFCSCDLVPPLPAQKPSALEGLTPMEASAWKRVILAVDSGAVKHHGQNEHDQGREKRTSRCKRNALLQESLCRLTAHPSCKSWVWKMECQPHVGRVSENVMHKSMTATSNREWTARDGPPATPSPVQKSVSDMYVNDML
eukprot:CAMPEP_0204162738 /NCGR_PEP_ID=MMETSP0361-20130328/35805_1 /ASSEMBLY_ACC=CAM_ASM_000343 /TAXON_ID=268821 /ORGANISM="Scrippsiella Hangoei, Strain SHTV-5" /LENGTH=302 /DNA_ID=CAMNT_0051119373 /DNA_START=92 /DNA_END=1004 /DNA_ORIENTATION=-